MGSTYKIKTGLECLRTRLPICRADLIAVSVNKLTRLNTTEKLLSISADVSCRHLVAYDLSLGIDNKGSALGKTVGLNQNSKIS